MGYLRGSLPCDCYHQGGVRSPAVSMPLTSVVFMGVELMANEVIKLLPFPLIVFFRGMFSIHSVMMANVE